MKKHLIGIFPCLLLALGGCGMINYDLSQDIDEIIVRGASPALTSQGIFPPMAMGFDLSQESAARKTGPAKAAYLKELKLHITDTARAGAADKDYFDFFAELSVYIESAGGSKLPKHKIAWVNNISKTAETLDFEVDEDFDLLPYINEGHRIFTDVAGIQPPADDVSYAGQLVITINI